MSKKLVDLNPSFYDTGGPGITKADGSPTEHRRGVGMHFDCPCGCGGLVGVAFDVALDGKPYPPSGKYSQARWKRTGDTFETMTLHPSIQRVGGCGWHGWLRDGELVSC